MAWAALEHAKTNHARVITQLELAQNRPKQVLNDIADSKTTLLQQFKNRDLAELDNATINLLDSIRYYMESVPFWKLFWRSDEVGDEIQLRMKEHHLIRLEHQVSSAIHVLAVYIYIRCHLQVAN